MEEEKKVPELSDETKEAIRTWLRGYRKGYGVNLEEHLYDLYDNDGNGDKEIRGKVLHELCDLCDEDFDKVTSWGY